MELSYAGIKVFGQSTYIRKGADGLLLRVYKTIDGSKSQKEIATELGTNEMAISRKIKILEEHGLIEIKEVGKNGKKIHKYSVAEKAFKLSKI